MTSKVNHCHRQKHELLGDRGLILLSLWVVFHQSISAYPTGVVIYTRGGQHPSLRRMFIKQGSCISALGAISSSREEAQAAKGAHRCCSTEALGRLQCAYQVGRNNANGTSLPLIFTEKQLSLQPELQFPLALDSGEFDIKILL